MKQRVVRDVFIESVAVLTLLEFNPESSFVHFADAFVATPAC